MFIYFIGFYMIKTVLCRSVKKNKPVTKQLAAEKII